MTRKELINHIPFEILQHELFNHEKRPNKVLFVRPSLCNYLMVLILNNLSNYFSIASK